MPDVLRGAGHTVYLQRDTYGTGAQDVDWLPRVGADGLILITKDQNIRRRPIEMQALVGARVRAFVLTAGTLTGADQAEVFRKALPKMCRIAQKTKPPFVANITASGHVQLLDLPPRIKKSHR